MWVHPTRVGAQPPYPARNQGWRIGLSFFCAFGLAAFVPGVASSWRLLIGECSSIPIRFLNMWVARTIRVLMGGLGLGLTPPILADHGGDPPPQSRKEKKLQEVCNQKQEHCRPPKLKPKNTRGLERVPGGWEGAIAAGR